MIYDSPTTPIPGSHKLTFCLCEFVCSKYCVCIYTIYGLLGLASSLSDGLEEVYLWHMPGGHFSFLSSMWKVYENPGLILHSTPEILFQLNWSLPSAQVILPTAGLHITPWVQQTKKGQTHNYMHSKLVLRLIYWFVAQYSRSSNPSTVSYWLWDCVKSHILSASIFFHL